MTLNYRIRFPEGFHSRPALDLIDLSKTNKNLNIRITKINGAEKNIACKNLIAILASNIGYQDEIELTCEDSEKNEQISKELNKIFN